jgi:thiol-disulfide isomerase/thioredoxin
MKAAARFALLLAAGLALAGCQRSTPPASLNAPQSPRQRIDALAARYAQAKTYQDAGELRFLVEGAPEDEFRSIPFSVALERPNRIRLHVLDTTTVADGQLLRSMVQSLSGQVLSRPCPAVLTLESIRGDELLDKAMQGQLDVRPPQLDLLLERRVAERWLRDATPTQLADSEFQGKKCRRIALAGPAGKSVLWIDAETGLLVKFEFPLDEIRKRFPLAALWAEFRGARLDEPVDPVAFQFEATGDEKLVKHFVMPAPPPPPALLNKPLGAYTFVYLDGSAVGSESLAGKIVVVDLWATWCGWCFEGLPLLEKVYQQYKDNDKIVFLAVSKDDLAVTNASVKEAFEKHQLTLPIARDQAQATDQLFQLEGLPTTVVIGADGTVQDYHVGYDPNLATALPAKLDKLLAGENLARAELDAYEQERRAFEERLRAALVNPEPIATSPGEAEAPSTSDAPQEAASADSAESPKVAPSDAAATDSTEAGQLELPQ